MIICVLFIFAVEDLSASDNGDIISSIFDSLLFQLAVDTFILNGLNAFLFLSIVMVYEIKGALLFLLFLSVDYFKASFRYLR